VKDALAPLIKKLDGLVVKSKKNKLENLARLTHASQLLKEWSGFVTPCGGGWADGTEDVAPQCG
jgi:hypothetical protein